MPISKVILTKECKGPGGVVHPTGKIIEGPDAHRLVELGIAKPYEEQAGRLAFIERMEQERAAAQPVEVQAEPEKPAEPELKGEAPNGNGNGEAAAQQSQE